MPFEQPFAILLGSPVIVIGDLLKTIYKIPVEMVLEPAVRCSRLSSPVLLEQHDRALEVVLQPTGLPPRERKTSYRRKKLRGGLLKAFKEHVCDVKAWQRPLIRVRPSREHLLDNIQTCKRNNTG